MYPLSASLAPLGRGRGLAVAALPTTNLIYDYRADLLGLNEADLIAAIVDSSPASHPTLTASGTARPTYRAAGLGGQPAMEFNGTSTFLDNGRDETAYTALTMFVVFQCSALARYAQLWGEAYFNLNWALSGDWAGATGKLQFSCAQDFSGILTTTSVTDGLPHLAVGRWNGSTAQLWLDGQSQGSRALSGNIGSSFDHVAIGAESSGAAAAFFNGKIAEAGLYNGALDDATVALIHTYAQGKWGTP